ncbi:MAG: endopeptidase La [Candidatus Zixiibacteriota bacterium]
MNIESLPVIALRNLVFFPGGTMPVIVGRDKTIKAVDHASETNNKVFLVAQKITEGDAEASNLYRTGTIGEIQQVIRMPNGILKVVISPIDRGKVIRFSTNPNFVEATCEIAPIISTKPETEKALYRRVIDAFEEFIALDDTIPDEIARGILLRQPPAIELVNLILAHVNLDYHDIQEILEKDTIAEMLKEAIEFLMVELEVQKYSNEIEDKVQDKIADNQKQFLLRQKMQALQEELGDKSEFQQEVNEYRAKLKKKKLPKTAVEVVERQIKRLSKMHPVSAEASVARTYIEWILDIPWSKKSKDQTDIEKAKKILDEDHYNLVDVKKRILEHIALVQHTGVIRGPILCLVGPPGVGKTSLGKSIARAMGRKFVRISLGGIDDESEIRGHRRTYIGALPGKIIQSMKKAGTVNPIFLLDEVDKLGKSIHGDPASALLEVLDPEQNNTFMDNYMEIEYDLSQVLFVTTANTTYGIPEPLMDRMEMLRIPGYTEIEKEKITQGFLIKKAAKEHGIKPDDIQFTSPIIRKIIQEYTREAGVRQLERELKKIMREYVYNKIKKGKAPFKRISEKMLRDILGVAKSTRDAIPEKLAPGASIGLAWTPSGGDAILVETALSPGSGKLTLTGQLGDVMQESAKAAFSFIKSRAVELDIDNEKFSENNVHIHIPGGAVPKDGPSAGVTLAMAIFSAFSGKIFPRNTSITGEITLSGRILPVGGLPEKLIAAKMYEATRVYLPYANSENLEEVDEKIKKGLDIRLCKSADRVLEEIFDIKKRNNE